MTDSKLAEFLAATNAGPEDAQAYLERANGDLPTAVSLYFAERSDGSGPGPGSRANSASASKSPSRTSLRSPSMSRSRLGSSSSSLSSGRPRIATFSDLAREGEAGQPASMPPADDPAQFFTGGERSGLAVTNPNDRRASGHNRDDAGSIVDEIIRKAQERGAEGGSAQAVPASRMAPQFSGRGFRLGSELEHALEEDDFEEDEEDDEDADQPVLQRTMYFWRNGFSIDDGPLFRFDDPQNAVYLRAINMGRAPIELLKVNPHQPVDVKLVQKPDTDYEKPKLPPSLDNAGPGHRLGSAVASAATSPGPASPSLPLRAGSASTASAEPTNGLGEEGDAAVQLRLADGSARRLRFHSQGLVQQLYDYVDALRPGRAYVLQTPLPPRRLEDRTQTLQSAGVVGAVIVQRWQ